jgi:branched-chain amino acid transport system permease protein
MDWRHSASPYLAPAVLLVAQLVLLPVPLGTFVAGALAGLVGSLAAVGLALVWRASRVINFAAGDLGIVPATLAVLLADQWGWNYWACAAAGLAAAVVLGVAVEGLIIRRFFDAPRVLLTVATIGLAQLLGFGALILPRAWGASPSVRSLPEPFGMSIEIGGTVFDGSDLVALFVVPLLLIGLVLVLNRTTLGVAIRASADRSSRALTLGIPVKRLQSLIWTLATVGAFVALFLTAGTGGLGVGYGTSLGLLLRAIAALVLGRMTHVGVIVFSSVVLGVLELAVRFQTGDGALVAPLLAAIIIGALLLRRMGVTRADRDDTSSWRLASDVRPVPAQNWPGAGR